MKMNKITKAAYIAAMLSSNLMCAVVAYKYCEMQWGIQYRGYSAPANAAFLWAIPFAISIAVCLIIAKIANKKHSDKMYTGILR